ncbi:hypothetical protein CYLTODRAFT_422779 [Cylindrobasidium torrendii FP15055 ss-10]|uniref:Arrestin-like N-terminal domain-containing protein n=1 Tax=Cylindrobasidium torrendii FP15055 ss-10 TaxID=1314674 RepID=A0A0D7BCB4_9AGAR|nr:hypothetical protein CYLTODRAFT_422779 [Cylindrobasidium torrendii FP15055 ss-10]
MPCTLEEDDTKKLPPTYNAMFYMAPTLWVGITFELIIQIKRTPQRFGLWNRGQRYSVEIEHRPRTRPARPISPCFDTILSTLKYVPDEWHQFSATLPAKNTGVESVNCTFLTPAVQTYGLEDAIPFHIQLSGPLGSLSLLVPDRLVMAVSLVRRTVVTVNGRTQWRNRSIGEGKVWAMPPPATASMDALGVYTDWEGEVRCTSEVRSGSFNIGVVAVQDYVLFALVPSGGTKAAFMPLQHLHPIRLVTDSWTEESWTHPLDI